MESPPFGTLPRGRHHLTREQVAASQRERLLQGMVEVVAEKGYAHCSVADVLKRARVSRETFYQHFADRHACFLAAYALAADLLIDVVAGAAAGTPPADRFAAALDAYLRALAADGPRARVFLLEIYAAGPDAAVRRFEVQRRFVELVGAMLLADERWARLPDPGFACRMLIGGISALVSGRVAAGEHAALPELHAPIVAHVRSLLER
ncbi:TetR/AcrR family transcriptional regulator [Actinomadura macrotermitis]|uniref:HTH tetR-type domain-containing protein n=1 Tax=Actinomadura macrotermitis TaxID=2585200 RepID=A0A7K0BWV7_9ACTN|nr:TetR/AcrR family transcriptional regulator [Actinomadura macrotermitis]MQY05663.1 hypothetical protein [Actinomadura macrotermitis]